MHHRRALGAEQVAELPINLVVPEGLARQAHAVHAPQYIVVHREAKDLVSVGFEQACLVLERLVLTAVLLVVVVAQQNLQVYGSACER